VNAEAGSHKITERALDDKPGTYACNVCDKRFHRRYKLNRHQRLHTGEKPYMCMICYKRFRQSSHLINHKRTHSGERPYRCSVCDKTFARSDHLKTHQRVHEEARPFQCDLCDKKFGTKDRLSRHKTVHVKEDLSSGTFELSTNGDNSDVSEHPHNDNKPRHVCTVAYVARGLQTEVG